MSKGNILGSFLIVTVSVQYGAILQHCCKLKSLKISLFLPKRSKEKNSPTRKFQQKYNRIRTDRKKPFPKKLRQKSNQVHPLIKIFTVFCEQTPAISQKINLQYLVFSSSRFPQVLPRLRKNHLIFDFKIG